MEVILSRKTGRIKSSFDTKKIRSGRITTSFDISRIPGTNFPPYFWDGVWGRRRLIADEAVNYKGARESAPPHNFNQARLNTFRYQPPKRARYFCHQDPWIIHLEIGEDVKEKKEPHLAM